MINKKIYIIFLSLIVFFNLVILTDSYSQVNPNQLKSDRTYSTRFIKPLVWSDRPYGIESSDAVISIGPFDNYQVSFYNGFAETDIICNPGNFLNFACTDNRVILGNPSIFWTTNGGVSWNSTNVPGFQGDPAFSADTAGNLYFAVLNDGPYVYRSSNLGSSWTSLGRVTAFNSGADKEWIAADQTNGPYKNNVYVAYVNFSIGPVCEFWRSTDNGTTWLGPQQMGNGVPNPGPDVAVDPNGKVYVAWYNGVGTAIRFSTDGGASFGSTMQASTHSWPGTIGLGNRNVLKDNIRVEGFPHIAIDETNGPFRGYVYVLYNNNPPGPKAADVYVTRSTDGGNTWNESSPTHVTWDDPTYNDNWMADVSVDNQGRVWAMWWDSRNDTANVLCETWGAVSTDGGVTFSHNFMISNQNFNPNYIRVPQSGSAYYLGDYQGISGKSFTFPCWTGSGNTKQDFVAYLPDYGIAIRESPDTVGQGGSSSNKILVPTMGPFSGTVNFTSTLYPTPTQGSLTFTWAPSPTLTHFPDSLTLTYTASGDLTLGTYTDTITATEQGGVRVHKRAFQIVVVPPIGIANNHNTIPKSYFLDQNYPNPFNPTTIIDYAVPKASIVSLKVYDVLGRVVATLINNLPTPAGIHMIQFNASNLPSGVYFYKMSAGDFTQVKKMTLIK